VRFTILDVHAKIVDLHLVSGNLLLMFTLNCKKRLLVLLVSLHQNCLLLLIDLDSLRVSILDGDVIMGGDVVILGGDVVILGGDVVILGGEVVILGGDVVILGGDGDLQIVDSRLMFTLECGNR